jgi:hypothetical protein
MKLLIPLELNLPQSVQIIDYHLYTPSRNYPEITINFETKVFKGEIELSLYANGRILEVENGKIKGSYKYSSPLEWTWNHFEFFFNNSKELFSLIEEINSGSPLIKEAQYRQNPPKDLSPEFLNGYTPEVVEDIYSALSYLFGLDNKPQILTSNSSEVKL